MDTQMMAHTVVAELAKRGLTVASAESCTGGMVAKYLTAVPGASAVFECGVVAYANRIKEQLLGVSGETLGHFGAVSRQTAEEMARGIRLAAKSDIGIATTGIAGPSGGTPEKPVGTVYIAAAGEKGCICEKLSLLKTCGNDRETIREETVNRLLQLVIKGLDRHDIL